MDRSIGVAVKVAWRSMVDKINVEPAAAGRYRLTTAAVTGAGTWPAVTHII